jgi:hypothetical protein
VTETRGGVAPARDLTGRSVVAGLFREREAAVAAIDELKTAQFRPADVGVALRDRTAQGELVEETGVGGTHAAEGAGAGAP